MRTFLQIIVLFVAVFVACILISREHILYLQSRGPVDAVELLAGHIVLSAIVATVAVVILILHRAWRDTARRRRAWLQESARAGRTQARSLAHVANRSARAKQTQPRRRRSF